MGQGDKREYKSALKDISYSLNGINNSLLDAGFVSDPNANALLAPDFDTISDKRPILKEMISDLSKVVGITATSPEGKAMATLAGPKAVYDPNQSDILLNARDKDMASNIMATKPPVLVMVGNDHLAGLADRVPDSVAVPYSINFENITRYPRPIPYMPLPLDTR